MIDFTFNSMGFETKEDICNALEVVIESIRDGHTGGYGNSIYDWNISDERYHCIECGCELEFEEIVDNENNICDKCLGDGDE